MPPVRPSPTIRLPLHLLRFALLAIAALALAAALWGCGAGEASPPPQLTMRQACDRAVERRLALSLGAGGGDARLAAEHRRILAAAVRRDVDRCLSRNDRAHADCVAAATTVEAALGCDRSVASASLLSPVGGDR